MALYNLPELLAQTPYPGRGILLGLGEGGTHAVLAYFIMGRSENSRNRVFTAVDGGLITEPADPAKLTDPSLILYAPIKQLGARTIVTNGDQTDTIYDCLRMGLSFEDALRSRTFEPDAPNFTPRISGLLTRDVDSFSYSLSILKSAGGRGKSAQRFFFDYPEPEPGVGHFIHTYAGEGEGGTLQSFAGEPLPVRIPGNTADFGKTVWGALNAENKVALYTCTIQLAGTVSGYLFNRYKKRKCPK